ncbi:MAG: glycosyltransferase family 4 protein [Chloroflexi bacterium]|nr:glycosyltransferase family 4 protein [Chloroflexota bacterium]
MRQIAILHYASAPVVGGVEATITYHARGLVDLGYDVRVISGVGAPFDPSVETHIEPLFGSKDPDVLAMKRALDGGTVPDDFEPLVERMTAALRVALDGCTVCIAHNVPTLNKNLPLSAALRRLSDAGEMRVIAWCHDLAWTNPQYLPELHDGYPWDVLRERWPGARYVTVSDARQLELAELLDLPPDVVAVVVPGIDPASFFNWTPTTHMIAQRLNLMDADGLLLTPARLTRRKNIQLGLRILAATRAQSGRDFRLVVTGPPGPHNPTNPGYLGELLGLRRDLGLDDSAHFLYAYGDGDEPLIPDDATMANLYLSCDALLFPSIQEGFGIPVLEAGLAGIPAFCADIPPLRKTGGTEAVYFDPVDEAPEIIAARILTTLEANPQFRLRVRVRQQNRWDVLIRECLVPLLEEH